MDLRRRLAVTVALLAIGALAAGVAMVSGDDDDLGRPSTQLSATGDARRGATDEAGSPAAEDPTGTSTGAAGATATDVVVPPVPRPDHPPTTRPAGIGVPGLPPAPDPADLPPPGPAPGAPSTTTTAPERGMVVLVTTDHPRYDEDQPVVVAVEVCNRDATPHRYAVARGQEVVVTIVDEGGRQVAADLPPATGSGTDEWEPGQCRSYGPFRWWQEWNHFDGTRAHGFPQPDAGRYAAVGAYTGNAAEPVVERGRAPFELNGVTVVVSTDRPSYAAGELVTATARVCNPFDRAEVETIVWQPEAVLRIHRDGYTIAQVHESGPVEPFPLPFAPRQCRDYRYVWDQRAEVWDPGTEDGRPSGGRVPPGTYSVEVLWWGHDHDRVGKGADARPGIVPDRLPFELR